MEERPATQGRRRGEDVSSIYQEIDLEYQESLTGAKSAGD